MDDASAAEDFWAATAAKYVDWISPWAEVKKRSLNHADVEWFVDGKLNVSVNCINRHLASKANQAAILREGDNEEESRTLTFAALYQEV